MSSPTYSCSTLPHTVVVLSHIQLGTLPHTVGYSPTYSLMLSQYSYVVHTDILLLGKNDKTLQTINDSLIYL